MLDEGENLWLSTLRRAKTDNGDVSSEKKQF